MKFKTFCLLYRSRACGGAPCRFRECAGRLKINGASQG